MRGRLLQHDEPVERQLPLGWLDLNSVHVHVYGVLRDRLGDAAVDDMPGDIPLALEGDGSVDVSAVRVGLQLRLVVHVPLDQRWRAGQGRRLCGPRSHVRLLLALRAPIRPRDQRPQQ